MDPDTVTKIPYMKLFKINSIICFVFIIFSFFSINNININSYEFSIYNGISTSTWFFLLFTLASNSVFLIYWAYIEKNYNKHVEVVSLLLIILIFSIIFLLPILKGYYFYGRGDEPTHIGKIKDLKTSGKIKENNIYPVIHILILTVSDIINMSLPNTARIIVLWFYYIYIIYIYILSFLIFKNIRVSIFVTFISVLIGVNIELSAHKLASLMIPLTLFIYLKIIDTDNKNLNFKILMLIFSIFYPFFHPLLSLILIFALVLIEIMRAYYETFHEETRLNRHDILHELIYKIRLKAPLISFIIFMEWMFNHLYFWKYNVINVIKWFLGEAKGTIGRTEEVINIFSEYKINFFEVAIKMYIDIIICLLLSLISIMIIFKYENIKNNNLKKIFVLAGWIIINFLFILISILPVKFGLNRPFLYAGLISPLYIGFLLLKLHKKTFTILLIILLILSINKILVIHPSPYIHVPNNQVTEMEINGMDWIFNNGNKNINVMSALEIPYRFADLILGINGRIKRGINSKYGTAVKMPDHFGYDKNETVGLLFNKNKYLVIGNYDKIVYSKLYPDANKFNLSDFEKLETDRAVNSIYSNNEFNVYLIRPLH